MAYVGKGRHAGRQFSAGVVCLFMPVPVRFPRGRQKDRIIDPQEPVLIAPVAVSRPQETENPVVSSGLESLRPTMVGQSPGYRRLAAARRPLRPRDIFADPDIAPIVIGSVLLHAALLIVAYLLSQHHQQRGNPQAEPGPVEMMFETPPAASGMQGRHSDQQAGGNNAASDSQSSESKQEEADSSPGSATESTEVPASPQIQQATSDEHFPTQRNETAPINPADKTSGQASRSPLHSKTARKASHQKQQHSHASSPFDSLMDLSLDQSSAPPRPRRGRSGGSGGPIDLSIGPMVQNGKLNAPYSTRSTTRGVSDGYAEEVDAWIRHHMYYPEDAARDGEEGPSSVHVVIDREGRVRSVRLTNQSGSYRLDASTTGMFHGAQLPPVPPGIPGDHFDLDVTINYILLRGR